MTSVLHGVIWSKCTRNDRCNYSLCRSPIKEARFSLTSTDVSLELQIWHFNFYRPFKSPLREELCAILRRHSTNTEISHSFRKRVWPQEKDRAIGSDNSSSNDSFNEAWLIAVYLTQKEKKLVRIMCLAA